ncbi:juvenile hormone esterase [Papilio machaon]|uniref:juvenile hormone esterase n=1 Tax=Papilio machaon TaxID=76193 RepID=UPI001E665D5D|nr:juvenile hormone esterase [Papilio machaon]
MAVALSVFSLCILGALAQTPQLRMVTIAQGTVVGSVAADGNYYEFHGIPYADSTSGSNRFKAPSPPPSFQSMFIANRKGVKCVRALGVGYEGTEDCLVADIYTPTLNNTDRLPVMVWIKGKEFDKIYEHDLSFTNFMERDVIIVSLNYRESILGFLCLGNEAAPGNAGLKDIVAGLRWVKQNIAQFGGDPDNISLFGHGSGAAAVDLVSLSPFADGLISKVISQSGTALSPWAVTRDNLKYAIEVAEALGHTINSIHDVTDAFKRTSVAALMAVINELDLTDNSLAFAPCLEREDIENVEPFLTKSPYTILTEGTYARIPFMTGFVDYEGTIRAEEALEDNWLEKMEESFDEFVQPDLKLEDNEDGLQTIQDIRSFYFRDNIINETQINSFLSYHGDTMILVSAIREASLRASSNSSVYLYQFSYKGMLGDPFVGPIEVNSAAHSEELAYLFYHESESQPSEMDLAVSDILVERWTNFAKTGTPESELSQVVWKPFTNSNSNYLRFLDDEEVNENQGGSLEVDLQNPHIETLLFWEQIYSKHFVDAKGRWDLADRGEDDDSDVIIDNGSGEEGSGEEGSGDEGSGDDGSGDEEGSGEEDDNEDDTNSASRLVGFTFLIVPIFALLNKFHMSHITL